MRGTTIREHALYWIGFSERTLMRASRDDFRAVEVAELDAGEGLVYEDDYYALANPCDLTRISLGRVPTAKTMHSWHLSCGGLGRSGHYLFFTSQGDGAVVMWRQNLERPYDVIDSEVGSFAFHTEADKTWVYWCDLTQVLRQQWTGADWHGTGHPKVIFRRADGDVGFTQDDNRVAIAVGTTGELFEWSKATQALHKIATLAPLGMHSGMATTLALVGDVLLWADFNGGRLLSVDLRTKTVTPVLEGRGYPHQVWADRTLLVVEVHLENAQGARDTELVVFENWLDSEGRPATLTGVAIDG